MTSNRRSTLKSKCGKARLNFLLRANTNRNRWKLPKICWRPTKGCQLTCPNCRGGKKKFLAEESGEWPNTTFFLIFLSLKREWLQSVVCFQVREVVESSPVAVGPSNASHLAGHGSFQKQRRLPKVRCLLLGQSWNGNLRHVPFVSCWPLTHWSHFSGCYFVVSWLEPVFIKSVVTFKLLPCSS